jgi:hypothetical protein
VASRESWLTNVPTPWRRATSPCCASADIALRTVARLTPNSAAS